MSFGERVRRYLDAWNRRDVPGILELVHPGAAYFDALYMETCVGRDLPKYLQDSLSVDEYWYEMIGDATLTEDGAMYRYAGRAWDGSTIGEKRFEGAEFLKVRGGKILTISNYYIDPDPKVLAEVARLAAIRHGEIAFVGGDCGTYKRIHVKNRLSRLMAKEKLYLDPTLTVGELAERIGCSVSQLGKILNAEFGTDFVSFVNHRRAEFAAELLCNYVDEPDRVSRAASEAGFGTIREFNAAFRKLFGTNPDDFRKCGQAAPRS